MSHEINLSEFSQFLLKAKEQTIIPNVKPQTQMQYVRSAQKVLRDLKMGETEFVTFEYIQNRYLEEHKRFDVSSKQARAYVLHLKACVSVFNKDSSSFNNGAMMEKTEKQHPTDMKRCFPKTTVGQSGSSYQKEALINEKLEEAEAERYMLDGANEAIIELLDATSDPSFEADLKSELDANAKARCKLLGKVNMYRRVLENSSIK